MRRTLNLDRTILTEINRMREIIGLNLITETIVPPELEQKVLKKVLGATEKQFDNLERAGIDMSSILKSSDELTRQGIDTFEEFVERVARDLGVTSVDDIDETIIGAWLKNNDAVYQKFAEEMAQKIASSADAIIKKTEWETLLPAGSADNITDFLSSKVAGTADELDDIKLVSDSLKKSVDDTIADLEARGETVPESLKQLSEELGEKSKQAETVKSSMNEPTIPNVEPEFPEPLRIDADEVITDPKTPIDEVLTKLMDSDIMNRYPSLSDEDIKLVADQMRARYGANFTIEQLMANFDQLRSDFMILMKKYQDEYDELLKRGDEDAAKKKKSQLESVKKVLKFITDNKVTQACVGSKQSVVGGKIVKNVDININTIWKTPLCLLGFTVITDFLYNYNKDPMEKEFILCPLSNAFGLCPTLPEGWCKNTCGTGTKTTNNTKFKDEQEELDVLLVDIKRQYPTLGANFKVTKVLNRDDDGNANSVSWSDTDANPSTGTMVLTGTTWQ